MEGPVIKIETAKCLACNCKILFHNTPYPGQIVSCPECYERFEVCRLNPLELDWAEVDFEDDDDYEEWA